VFVHTASFFSRRNALSKRKLPDYRLKQKILYIDKTSAETLIRYADLYLEENALTDALDFYIKAGSTAGIEKIKNIALNSGDVFLFQGAAKALQLELRNTDWEEIARRAMDLKKYAFARYALEKSSNQELLNALTTQMKAEAAEKHS
jgi:hypothetical protein